MANAGLKTSMRPTTEQGQIHCKLSDCFSLENLAFELLLKIKDSPPDHGITIRRENSLPMQ